MTSLEMQSHDPNLGQCRHNVKLGSATNSSKSSRSSIGPLYVRLRTQLGHFHWISSIGEGCGHSRRDKMPFAWKLPPEYQQNSQMIEVVREKPLSGPIGLVESAWNLLKRFSEHSNRLCPSYFDIREIGSCGEYDQRCDRLRLVA